MTGDFIVIIPRRCISRVNSLFRINDTYNQNEICEFDIYLEEGQMKKL